MTEMAIKGMVELARDLMKTALARTGLEPGLAVAALIGAASGLARAAKMPRSKFIGFCIGALDSWIAADDTPTQPAVIEPEFDPDGEALFS